MGILASISSNGKGGKSKWTNEEEILFVEGLRDGIAGDELENHVGRPKTGFYAKKGQLDKRFTEAGCETMEDCIAFLNGKTISNTTDDVEETA